MSSWITLTPALLQNRLSGPEFAALKNAARGAGQDGDAMLSECISAVVREVRGYVGACKSNILGEGETIPGELEHAALAMLRQRFANRLPGLVKLTGGEDRKTEYDDAMQLMRDVAACRFAIIQPEVAAPQQPGAPVIQLVSAPRRKTSRDQLAGL